jgi:hypothetical protein
MKKQKILALIPLIIAGGLLIYTWSIILFTDIVATWRDYVGLLLFLPLPYLQIKKFEAGLWATGSYFIVGTCNLLSLTPDITTHSYGINIGTLELSTPAFQLLPFGLLIIYFIVNFNSFVNIYVEHKFKDSESKKESVNISKWKLADFIVNSQDVDLEDICSCWQWRLRGPKRLVLISKLGDLFLIGNDECIYWLHTDSGDLTRIADNLEHFEQLLQKDENLDQWFLPSLLDKLANAGKILAKNQVYSYKKLPVIGGEYSMENIDPLDMSVHFAFSGQICEQIQNLPDGTKVKITVKPTGVK